MADTSSALAELFETELSCVKYHQGNKAWAYISLLPLFAAVFQLGRFWTSRSIEDGFVFIGFLVTEAINKVLKRHFKQDRPPTCEQLGVCSSYGYPSSHSQCIWYFITCGSLVLWRRWALAQQNGHGNESSTRRPGRPSSPRADLPPNTLALLAAVFTGITVPASRVVLGYHTVEQVVVGSGCGVLCGLVGAWVTLGPVGVTAARVCSSLRLPQLLGVTSYVHGVSDRAPSSESGKATMHKRD